MKRFADDVALLRRKEEADAERRAMFERGRQDALTGHEPDPPHGSPLRAVYRRGYRRATNEMRAADRRAMQEMMR